MARGARSLPTPARPSMRAVVQDRYGPPGVLRLEAVERPVPAPDELLVRVFASTVSPADCAFRAGRPLVTRLFHGALRPRFVPGGVLAGVVEEAGARVRRFAPGDRVFGSTGAAFGAHAEHVRLSGTGVLAASPEGLTHAEAAALCDGALTALTFLRDAARVRPGQRVLVHGATGSVGAAGVQIAKHLGAEVTGVCSTGGVALVRSLGADAVIDRTQQDFTAAPGAYHVIFDAVGKSSYRRCRRSLTADGTYLTTAPSLAILAQGLWTAAVGRRRARLVLAGLRQTTEDLELVARLGAEGHLRPVVDRVLALEDVVEAHRYVETGRKRGSVVVQVAAPG